ncbi:MAG: hypothetical protein KDC71_15655 [Acidobacteria bacterium]|nr:hypothetical protein [Acidobacteriota bacterium]
MKYAWRLAFWILFGLLVPVSLAFFEIFLIDKRMLQGPVAGWGELGYGSRGYVAGVLSWVLIFILSHCREKAFLKDLFGVCLAHVVIFYLFSFYSLLVFAMVPIIFAGLYFGIQYFRERKMRRLEKM